MTQRANPDQIAAMRFGVEIECNTTASQAATVRALQAFGISAAADSYSGRNGSGGWLVKPDGSIGTGWEIVSPPLSLADLGTALPSVCNGLADVRATVSDRCGLHVHLSLGDQVRMTGSRVRAPVSFHTVRNVARRWVNFEDTLQALQPVARRGNTYCKSNRAVFGADPTTATVELWERIERCNSTSDLVRMFNPNSDRYYMLNLCSLMRHGTIEIRHGAASVDAAEIFGWTRFIAEFTSMAMQQERLWHRPVSVPETARERLRKLLRGLTPETVRYITARFNRFAAR